MAKFIVGDKLLQALYDAGVLGEEDWRSVRRLVIDLEHGQPGKLYVEMFADDDQIESALTAGIVLTDVPPPTLGKTLPSGVDPSWTFTITDDAENVLAEGPASRFKDAFMRVIPEPPHDGTVMRYGVSWARSVA